MAALTLVAALAPALAWPATTAAPPKPPLALKPSITLDSGNKDSPFSGANPYVACVKAIDVNPSDAFENALTWRDRGGGILAERCAALALIALDVPGEAATRLDALARRPNAGTLAERASMLTQSGNAWLLAGQPQTAEAAFSAALKLAPRDSEIRVDRARARAALMNWPDAEADLTAALTLNTRDPEIYVLRASARHARGDKDGYRRDIAQALLVDPNYSEALVEAGTIKMEDGDLKGARADWLHVLVQSPDSDAGDAVRMRIQGLEVRRR